MADRRILLIANPGAAAGRAQRRWNTLLAGLRERGLNAEHVITTYPHHGVTLAQDASRDYDVIVAVGGDGTVNEVASGLLLSGAPETAMGIVPIGTGNDIAAAVGIASVEDALNALVQGVPQPIDAIEVRCYDAGAPVTRYALLYAAVGFSGDVLKYTTPWVKRLFGPRYCYSVGFFRALVTFKAPVMKVSCEGHDCEGRLFLVFAGNTERVGGGVMRLSPGAEIDDGQFNVSIVEALGRFETTQHFPRILAGTHVTHPKVRYFTATSLAVEADPVIDVQVDGDLFGHTPAEFRMKPQALKIMRMRDEG